MIKSVVTFDSSSSCMLVTSKDFANIFLANWSFLALLLLVVVHVKVDIVNHCLEQVLPILNVLL
jgi:hypothetical protein